MNESYIFASAQRRFEEPEDLPDLPEHRPGFCPWCDVGLESVEVDGDTFTICPNAGMYLNCGYNPEISEEENQRRHDSWEI